MFKKLFARFFREDDGGVFVTVAVSSVVLIAFVGLAIDMGNWYTEKRRLQTAADTVAMAAALERARGATLAEVDARAKAVALQNGYTHGTDGVTVTLNNPPTSGNFIGNAAYVEAIVLQPTSAMFTAVLNPNDTDVSARAVATTRLKPSCIYSLEETDTGVTLVGSANLTMNCGLQVNSSSEDAVTFTGAAACADVPSIQVVGDTGGTPSNDADGCRSEDKTVTGVPAAEDPFSYLAPPKVPADCTNGYSQGIGDGSQPTLTSADGTILAGCYLDGLIVTAGNATFESGLYIIGTNGLHFIGGGNATGTDLTFYFGTDAIGPATPKLGGQIAANTVFSISGGYNVNLKASHPDYPGILFYQDKDTPKGDPTAAPPIPPVKMDLTGGANISLEGVLYFPSSEVSLQGDIGSSSEYTILVTLKTNLIGNASISNGSLPGTLPLSVSAASLAE